MRKKTGGKQIDANGKITIPETSSRGADVQFDSYGKIDCDYYSGGGTATIRNPGIYCVACQSSEYFVCYVVMKTPADASQKTAQFNMPSLTINGKTPRELLNGSVTSYCVDDNNYIKLRSIAAMLNNTAKQFSVDWDQKTGMITLTGNQAYAPLGDELPDAVKPDYLVKKTQITVNANGKKLAMDAICINGYNYVKLRDVASAMNFGVSWDAATSTVVVDTSVGYTA